MARSKTMNEASRPATILVVDDDPQMCELIADLAGDLGFAVVTALNFDAFQAQYEATSVDVIVLDLQMPDVDGVEYLRRLGEAGCQATILLMSGYDSRVLHTASRYGESQGLRIRGAVEKPFEVDDLRARFEALGGDSQSIAHDDLERAIANRELFLQFQPKVRLGPAPAGAEDGVEIVCPSGRWPLDSFEALVRWQHPVHGRLPPDRFIPLAETSGLIRPLTDFVMEEAVRQLAGWSEHGVTATIAINWPTHMLTDLEAPDRLAKLMDDAGVPRERIALEVTETAAMTDTVRAMDVLSRARLKGFRLAMDDFGTGYSSLVQLHRMPFSELKIDKSIILELCTDSDAAVIVRAVVDLAHNLGLKVCAEGAENARIVERLREYGCDIAQGYHFSAAIDGAEVPRIVGGHDGASSDHVPSPGKSATGRSRKDEA